MDKSGHLSCLQLVISEVVKPFNVFVSIVAKAMKLGTFLAILIDVIQMIFSAKADWIFGLYFLPTTITCCPVRVKPSPFPLSIFFLLGTSSFFFVILLLGYIDSFPLGDIDSFPLGTLALLRLFDVPPHHRC